MPMVSSIGLTQTVPPVQLPVEPSEFKSWLGYGSDDQNSVLYSLLAAATEWAENYTNRQFVTATHQLKLQRFSQKQMHLPKPPLQSVTSIVYVDTDGTTKTLPTSEYDVSTSSSSISPAYLESWPSHRDDLEPITITYVSGYGVPSAVPETIKHAIMLIAGKWWNDMQCGCNDNAIPVVAESMLSQYRLVMI